MTPKLGAAACPKARRSAVRAETLPLLGWLVVAVLLPSAASAQPVALARLTCTSSDILNVTVTRSDRQLAITWDAVEDALHYDVSWSPASDDGTSAARVQGTTYTITGLSNIVEYTIAVRADTTLSCSATVPTVFPQCPTNSLNGSVIPGNELLTVLWDAVSGVSVYEIGWDPPSTDGRRAANVQNLIYTIGSLQNDVEYTVTLGAGPDTACIVNGTPVGNDVEPDGGDSNDQHDEEGPTQVSAIPFGGLVGLALALMGGATLRRSQAIESRQSEHRRSGCQVGPRSPDRIVQHLDAESTTRRPERPATCLTVRS